MFGCQFFDHGDHLFLGDLGIDPRGWIIVDHRQHPGATTRGFRPCVAGTLGRDGSRPFRHRHPVRLALANSLRALALLFCLRPERDDLFAASLGDRLATADHQALLF